MKNKIEERKNRIKDDIEMLEKALDEMAKTALTINNESDLAKILLAIKCNSYTTLLAVLEMHLDLLERT